MRALPHAPNVRSQARRMPRSCRTRTCVGTLTGRRAAKADTAALSYGLSEPTPGARLRDLSGQSFGFRASHLGAKSGHPHAAAAFISGDLLRGTLLDEASIYQTSESAIESARVEAEPPIRSSFYVFHDIVAVTFPFGQRQQDLERDFR
jgi:hypothetical protein